MFHLYNLGLNLQQLIGVQCPIKIFLTLKSLLLDKLIAIFIRLSSKDGHTKKLKSGDQQGVLIYFIGFIFTLEGDKFIIF